MARTVNLNLRQGETFRWSPVLHLSGVIAGEPGDPMDISGCTARAQFRERYGSPVLTEITTENGGIEVGPVAGQLHLWLTDEQTDALGTKEGSVKPRVACLWDLELVYPSGDVQRPFQGAVTIDPNITREVD